MRKVFLIAVLSLVTMTAFAQEEAETENDLIEAQYLFSEIAINEVPAVVKTVIKKGHQGSSIAKAYVNEAKHYKLEVIMKDGEELLLFTDADGNWLEM